MSTKTYEQLETEVKSFIENVLKDDKELNDQIQHINDCCYEIVSQTEEFECERDTLIESLITQIEEKTDIKETESGSFRHLIFRSLQDDHGLESHPYY